MLINKRSDFLKPTSKFAHKHFYLFIFFLSLSLSQGHMFSLGSTLWAALDSVSEAELSEESRCLLKQMQREKPEDRPRLQVHHWLSGNTSTFLILNIAQPFDWKAVLRQNTHTHTLLKTKLLHDATEEAFCLNGSIKNLRHLKNLSVSHKLLCVSSGYKKLRKRCSLKNFWLNASLWNKKCDPGAQKQC